VCYLANGNSLLCEEQIARSEKKKRKKKEQRAKVTDRNVLFSADFVGIGPRDTSLNFKCAPFFFPRDDDDDSKMRSRIRPSNNKLRFDSFSKARDVPRWIPGSLLKQKASDLRRLSLSLRVFLFFPSSRFSHRFQHN